MSRDEASDPQVSTDCSRCHRHHRRSLVTGVQKGIRREWTIFKLVYVRELHRQVPRYSRSLWDSLWRQPFDRHHHSRATICDWSNVSIGNRYNRCPFWTFRFSCLIEVFASCTLRIRSFHRTVRPRTCWCWRRTLRRSTVDSFLSESSFAWPRRWRVHDTQDADYFHPVDELGRFWFESTNESQLRIIKGQRTTWKSWGFVDRGLFCRLNAWSEERSFCQDVSPPLCRATSSNWFPSPSGTSREEAKIVGECSRTTRILPNLEPFACVFPPPSGGIYSSVINSLV